MSEHFVQQMSKTFLDRLVVLDCGLCLVNIIVLIPSNDISGVDDLGACEFFVFLLFKVNLMNKLLTVGIVIYRFTLVTCSSFVQTPQQRKFLENCILMFIFLTSFTLTSLAFYYREDYRQYLGRYEEISDLISTRINDIRDDTLFNAINIMHWGAVWKLLLH